MLLLSWGATAAPVAHVLELPNKLALDGPSWLLVQQRLYQGWGVIFGPVEITALIFGVVLAIGIRADRRGLRRMILAVGAYAVMVADFFVMNAPVNDAVNRWTWASLPADWPRYRLQWECGHAVAAILSLMAFVAVLDALRFRGPARHPAARPPPSWPLNTMS